MNYLTSVIVLALFGSFSLAAQQERRSGADMTPLHKPVSPLSKPLSAIRGDPRVYDTVPPPRNNVWGRIQDPLDRSLGRIEDRSSDELGRIERRRDERLGRIEPITEIERLQLERERQLRLQDLHRRQQQQHDDPLARRREMERREYLLYLNGQFSPLAAQVEQDRQALLEARRQRDEALFEADMRLRHALEQPGTDQARLRAEYEAARQAIRHRYDETRARILGY